MENICLDCGMCCDGTMFTCVDLEEGDRETVLADSSLAISGPAGGRKFQLPCPAFRGCCSIYESRPAKCRQYRCNVRIQYDECALSLEGAQAFIASAKQLRGKVRPALEKIVGATDTCPLDHLYERAAPILKEMTSGDAVSGPPADLLMDMGALRILLVRHFGVPLPGDLGKVGEAAVPMTRFPSP